MRSNAGRRRSSPSASGRRRLKRIGTLRDFDFAFNPRIRRSIVTDLATCLFIEKKGMSLFTDFRASGRRTSPRRSDTRRAGGGTPRSSSNRRRCSAVSLQREPDHSWERQLKKYTRPDLLIIDDFGLTALTQVQAEDFYGVVTERHLRSSILITNNRPPPEQVALFPDPVMANSALDRLNTSCPPHHG